MLEFLCLTNLNFKANTQVSKRTYMGLNGG